MWQRYCEAERRVGDALRSSLPGDYGFFEWFEHCADGNFLLVEKKKQVNQMLFESLHVSHPTITFLITCDVLPEVVLFLKWQPSIEDSLSKAQSSEKVKCCSRKIRKRLHRNRGAIWQRSICCRLLIENFGGERKFCPRILLVSLSRR